MATRFGGRFSPSAGGGAAEPGTGAGTGAAFKGRRASSVDVRAVLLFFFPTPLLLAALGALGAGAAVRMTALLLAYAILMLGAWLLREGQRAEAAFAARTIARPPAFPRKMAAAVLAGVGVALASWLGDGDGAAGAFAAAVFGALATASHVVAFGVDPMRAKGLGSDLARAELDRVAGTLEKAEATLASIETLAHRMRDREIDARLGRLNASVREMIRLVERDPRDLGRARRYLGVYLKGAEEATRKYAGSHERHADASLRADYLALLGDLERSFARGKDMLLIDDRIDLEVEIEVLRERLAQEGA